MDLRTGKIYNSVEEAMDDGVPESDIARIESDIDFRKKLNKLPKVSFDDHMKRIMKDFQHVRK